MFTNSSFNAARAVIPRRDPLVLDLNGDGQITSGDTASDQLQVWRDANRDGISQSGELSGLDALGITHIGLDGSSTGLQAGHTININRVTLSATFTQAGISRTVGAIDLEANAFFRRFLPVWWTTTAMGATRS